MTTIPQHQKPTKRVRSTRRGLVGGSVIIAAAALVACSGSPTGTEDAATPTSAAPTTATSAASTTLAGLPALGVELLAIQIPWNQVGPGWILATWSPAPGLHPGETPPPGQPRVAPATLYLLDPAGGRYAITTFPVVGADAAADDPGHTPGLADWSGDGRHALFTEQGVCPQSYDSSGWHCTDPNAAEQYTTMTDVDLATGAKQTFTVGTDVDGNYSWPTGQAILLSTRYPDPSALKRVDLSGTEQLTYPSDLGAAGNFAGGYLASPDGTQLVFGAANGMVVVGNDGVVGRQLPIPGGVTGCSPVRWWTSSVILARCDVGKFPDSASQLWQVPVDDGAPTALTAPNSGQEDSGFGADLGDGDAWQLPSGTFLQSAGACGTEFLSRLTPDMHTTPVTVPGVDSSSVHVTGATADELVLQARAGCGRGTSLLTYDPAANTSTVLLGPPVNGGGVQHAIVYPTS
jgi:hypothetical protein